MTSAPLLKETQLKAPLTTTEEYHPLASFFLHPRLDSKDGTLQTYLTLLQ